MPVKEFGIQTNFLAKLSNLVGVEQFLWIACDSNKAPSKMDPELKSTIIDLRDHSNNVII